MEPQNRSRPSEAPQVGYVIFASPKSGTQWIQQLLCSHPDVQCAESRAFGVHFDPKNVSAVNITLDTFVSNLGKYHRPPVAPAQAGAYFRGLSHNLLDTIARTSLEAGGKTLYGEKITPFAGTARAVVERLAEYNPDLRFCHLSRDGRDVVVSALIHQHIVQGRAGTPRGRALEAAVSRQRVPHDVLEMFMTLWMETVTAGLGAADTFSRYLHLRYEDLLADTPGQARRLLEFIGADAGADIVGRCVEAASFEAMSGGRRRGEEDVTSFVRKGAAGDWRRWLTDQQAAWFDQCAGEMLEALGYARATSPARAAPCPETVAGP
ncbi:MAG: sulfotransferase domain-containing protein [Planctomycetota bacterium]|jgi:hypothetical protein